MKLSTRKIHFNGESCQCNSHSLLLILGFDIRLYVNSLHIPESCTRTILLYQRNYNQATSIMDYRKIQQNGLNAHV